MNCLGELSFVAAVLLGFLGSGHCLGMCGGVMGALLWMGNQPTEPAGRRRVLFGYHLGRITTYAAIGALSGWAAASLAAGAPSALRFLRVAAAVMLVGMGAYVAGWTAPLAPLERAGGVLWRRVQPLALHWLPARTLASAWVVGLAWGWLPCGLVYSALAWSTATADPLQSALLMAGFGLGTLPAMLTGGWLLERARHWSSNANLRALVGVGVMLFGLWSLSTVAHWPSNPSNPGSGEVHVH
ncbi:MAG: sulfite exporter TauE/SafE family protein [Pseudomonadota bacterium]|nr:sulfite exporter TauE/SafE family protein [Pseudomonadota bacterium]